MGYDPIDTDETDSNADKEITVDAINGADVSAASAEEVLSSDGSGDLQFTKPGGVPTGGIIMWSGAIANIPSGFALCDGNNGTPDLTDRFVVGAGGSEAVGDTGGTDTQSVNLSVSDSAEVNFSGSKSNQTLSDNRLALSDYGRALVPSRTSNDLALGGIDSSTSSFDGYTALVNVNASGSDSFNNRPAYYALAYIMKT